MGHLEDRAAEIKPDQDASRENGQQKREQKKSNPGREIGFRIPQNKRSELTVLNSLFSKFFQAPFIR